MELVWAAGVRERIREDLLSRAPSEYGGAVLLGSRPTATNREFSRSITHYQATTRWT